MKRRLWITGATGFVGGHAVRIAGDAWDVCAVTRREAPLTNPAATPILLDITDPDALAEGFHAAPPRVLIHCAAIADIDYCQQHPEEATRINFEATRHLAELCAEHKTRMIFCSTDTVFDGEHSPYKEDDVPFPVNHYGHTKVQAEEAVRGVVANAVVARVALVMGFSATGSGNAFLPKLMANLAAGKPTSLPENELRSPVDVITLATALLELAGNDFTGTLHLSGNTQLIRTEMGRRIAAFLGHDPALIEAVNSNAMAGRAPRPNHAALDNHLARAVLKTPMRDLEEALELVLTNR
jgi:dTDP-4-dehydrorhamnose reductase